MPQFIERVTMTYSTTNWEKMAQFERDFTDCEDSLGNIPRKKWLRPFSSPQSLMSTQWEREWDSLSEMEAAGGKMEASEEHTKIRKSMGSSGILNSFHRELLQIENPLE